MSRSEYQTILSYAAPKFKALTMLAGYLLLLKLGFSQEMRLGNTKKLFIIDTQNIFLLRVVEENGSSYRNSKLMAFLRG